MITYLVEFIGTFFLILIIVLTVNVSAGNITAFFLVHLLAGLAAALVFKYVAVSSKTRVLINNNYIIFKTFYLPK